MQEAKVLVIDRNAERAKRLGTVLDFVEHPGEFVTDCRSWLEQAADPGNLLAVVLGDCGSQKNAAEVVEEVRSLDDRLPIFVLRSAEHDGLNPGDLGTNVLGVIDDPIRYPQLNSFLERAQIFRESSKTSGRQRPVELFRSLVGNSRAIQNVKHMIDQVADTDANVLILGESGTGKEVVARNIHYKSSRRDMPFVPINCGAIPADLLESELFGHEKGAFTGAISARKGRFEMAEGGTLFLDEIGDMSLNMQVKLLRVLQERVYERVGGNRSMTADVRIVAATHRNLEQAIKDGTFREDLYYRLNVFPIDMPPLRERVEDIPLLINELIARIEHEKRGSVGLTSAAVLSLCRYGWPGNVRELANLIERLAILFPFGQVDVMDLPEKFRLQDAEHVTPALQQLAPPLIQPHAMEEPRLPREGIDLKAHLAEMEVSYIRQALKAADGVVAHAAKLLKMRRTTLVEKMRKYGLHKED